MYYSNQISTSVNQKEAIQIKDSIRKIDDMLPDLVTLSNEELATIPHMSSDTIDFIYEALDLAKQYPEMIPDNIDITEIKKDVELIEAINRILIPMRHLVKKLEDSALLAGSEAYMPSLAIYNSVKLKAKMKVKGTIV